MSEMDFEKQIYSIAQQMTYPRTPDVARHVMIRSGRKPRVVSTGLAWSLTVIVVLLVSLMLIPPARAAILEFIEIGIVRIFPPSTESPIKSPQPATPQSLAPVTSTPYLESSRLLLDLSRLAGETTFANAQQRVPYSILLPTYPASLGEPDHTFVQDADGEMTILVWLDRNDSQKVLMSLHFIPSESWAIKKLQPLTVEVTEVNGHSAAWTTGPYFLLLSNRSSDLTRMIDGHVLIWEQGNITFRLETALSIEEAIRVAESLEPMP